MSTSKATGFDKATGSEKAEVVDDAQESGSNIPRAVFTREQNIDMSKLQISQLRLAQGMTAEVKDRKAAIGQFVLSNYPAYDEVVLIPLGAQNIRVYKPDPKAAALCHAPTGDFGFGNPGGLCEECPLSQWTKNEETGKTVPPPCKEGVIVRMYSVTHRSMIDYQFLGGDQRIGGFIQQQSMSFGWTNFAIKMTSTSKENNRGSWFVPQVEMLPDDTPAITDDQRAVALKWYDIFCQGQVETKEQALFQLTSGA